MKLTNKQRKILREERTRVMAEGEQIFSEMMEGKIEERDDADYLDFLKHFFADAFWQGYLYSAVERAKANHDQ